MAPDDALLETDRTTLRRHRERGSFDRALALTIIDEAYIAHVGISTPDGPRVLPMTYGRIDDSVYLHGAAGNAILRGASGAQVCVTFTILDGLVLARSAFHHSMEYRSVVLFGEAVRVDDEAEKLASLEALVDHVVPGRTAEARAMTPGEVRSTLVLRVPIEEGSVKVRSHGVRDEPEDADHPAWAGVVPISIVAGEPVQDSSQAASGSSLAPPAPGRLERRHHRPA